MKTKIVTIILSIVAIGLAFWLTMKPAYTDIPELQSIEQTENITITDSHEITESVENTINTTVPHEITSDMTQAPTPVCEHKEIKEEIVQYATCSNNGKIKVTCTKCSAVLNDIEIDKKSHDFQSKTIESTCAKSGKKYDECKNCGYKTNEKTIEKLECNYEFINESYATPFENGKSIIRCKVCNWSQETTIIYEQVSPNSIYIPTASINQEYAIGECNQTNTDANDITLDYELINANNPVIFGHNTRTLGKLHNTNIGDYIYLVENGNISTYKVTHSEPGQDVNNGTNIKGVNTGKLCIEKAGTKTLHIFTCYWHLLYGNIRWIVVAELQ